MVVTALFGRQDQAWFNALRREHYPPERNMLDAHLTLFHHLPPSVNDELKHRLTQETRGVRAPRARISCTFDTSLSWMTLRPSGVASVGSLTGTLPCRRGGVRPGCRGQPVER